MEDVYSRSEDVMWLAQRLKNVMGGYVSFNQFGIDNPLLTGVYCKDGRGGGPYYSKDDVRFYIKFCKDEFLRIQIPENCYKIENVILAMEELVNAISFTKKEGISLGSPLAIYQTDECLTCEYAFKNQKEVAQMLQNNTMFDDGEVSNLRLLNSSHVYDSQEIDIKKLCKTIYDK